MRDCWYSGYLVSIALLPKPLFPERSVKGIHPGGWGYTVLTLDNGSPEAVGDLASPAVKILDELKGGRGSSSRAECSACLHPEVCRRAVWASFAGGRRITINSISLGWSSAVLCDTDGRALQWNINDGSHHSVQCGAGTLITAIACGDKHRWLVVHVMSLLNRIALVMNIH
jgi:hypothetical protein